ncbi:hypothetical protein [uncultured Winogradskyella sp.]|uniref:hypothetical protein n=1 Tax=uncultured Winogradskyella sp. TaxID=395353 RepID=UPI002639D413|nr:hypothetical protein [uncultured Winogradskyella sp.]
MKIKKLLLLFILTPLLTCEVRLENDTRIMVTGVVLDQNNSPIPEAKISIATKRGSGIGGGQSQYILGEGYSKSNGSFSVISFYDKDEDFAIEVDAGEIYSRYVYKNNTEDYTPVDLTFSLGEITLKKLANFNYNVIRTSGDGNTITFRIRYIDPVCLETYEGTILNELQTYCFQEEVINRSLGNNLPNLESNLRVLFGESIEFAYSINDEPEITQIITIDEENYDFSLNY